MLKALNTLVVSFLVPRILPFEYLISLSRNRSMSYAANLVIVDITNLQ
jgi:hypothetical protein